MDRGTPRQAPGGAPEVRRRELYPSPAPAAGDARLPRPRRGRISRAGPDAAPASVDTAGTRLDARRARGDAGPPVTAGLPPLTLRQHALYQLARRARAQPVGCGVLRLVRGGPFSRGWGEALDERERLFRDLAPTAVDRERVTAVGDRLDFGDRLVVSLALERRVCDRRCHRVVDLSLEDQQRPAIRVLGVQPCLRARVQVGI